MSALLALVPLLGCALARSVPPEPSAVTPPAEVPSIFPMATSTSLLPGLAPAPACRALAEELSLCFVKGKGDELDYVTPADLSRWGMDLAAVEAQARETAAAGFRPGRPAQASVEGMSGHYWVSSEADGLDAAGLLYPERLAEIAGANPVVAVPAQGVLLFWVPGDEALDKVLAVGARKIQAAADQPVSKKIYRWEEGRWSVWGEAVRASPGDGLSRPGI